MKTIHELIDESPEPTIENAVRIFVRYFIQTDLDHSKNNFSKEEYVDPQQYYSQSSSDSNRNNCYIAMQIIDRIHWYLAKTNNLGLTQSIPKRHEKIIGFKENELCKILGFTDDDCNDFAHFQLFKVPCPLTRYDVCGLEPDLL